MPSSMIHLLTAYKYNPNACQTFFIGNIAPDSVSDWKEKDKSHFRDKTDRLVALKNLALSIDLSSDFNKGILLHLFLDYHWDTDPMKNYIKMCKEDKWFQSYREEIALAGGWIYHNTEWGKAIWNEMMECPPEVYEDIHGIKKEEVFDFIVRNSKWHKENNIGPSSAFEPEYIDKFTSKVAKEFKNWLLILENTD